jgi:putative flavoprotein involved in K+ transport
MPPTERVDVVVLGAAASGLAAGAVMKRRGLDPLILEADARIGGIWAGRYERLHLHTPGVLSGLPYHPLPRHLPRYVPKDDYAIYLADYARHHGLRVELNRQITKIRRAGDGQAWVLQMHDGPLEARAVVVATGKHRIPRLPPWPGTEQFRGTIAHSADYRSGEPHAGSRVLVVGIGNSGAEIAADLVESGAGHVAIAVRASPAITSREILGIPVQVLGILLKPFPPKLVDRLGARLRRFANGDLSAYGIGPEAWGPFTARRPPVIDVGFLEQLKGGKIDVRPDLSRLTEHGVVFADGRTEEFDAIVAATGFSSGLDELLDAREALDECAYPLSSNPLPGLFFIGFNETQRGALFEVNLDSRALARQVERYLRRGA